MWYACYEQVGGIWFCQRCIDAMAHHDPQPVVSTDALATLIAWMPSQRWLDGLRDRKPRPGKEPNQEPVQLAPLPPYAYPSVPGGRSMPGTPRASQRVRDPEPVIVPQTPVSDSPTGITTSPFMPACREPEHSPDALRPTGEFIQHEPIPTTQKKPLERIPEQPRQSTQAQLPEGRTITPTLPEGSPETEGKSDKRKKDFPEIPSTEKVSSGNGKRRTLKLFNGKAGRKHKEWQIEDILDNYLQTGRLPHYVSDRQHRYYKRHRTLPERRKLLEEGRSQDYHS